MFLIVLITDFSRTFFFSLRKSKEEYLAYCNPIVFRNKGMLFPVTSGRSNDVYLMGDYIVRGVLFFISRKKLRESKILKKNQITINTCLSKRVRGTRLKFIFEKPEKKNRFALICSYAYSSRNSDF